MAGNGDDGPRQSPWGQTGMGPGSGRPGSVPGGAPGGGRPNPPKPPFWAGNRPTLPGGLGALLPRGTRGIVVAAFVFVGIWLASGFYRVEPDEAGVVQRFGAFVRLMPPGLNYHLPYPIESVQLPSVTRINRVEVGYRSAASDDGDDSSSDSDQAGPHDVPAESLMLTGDENIIDINFAVFWRIGDAKSFLFATRDPALAIKDVAESVMREVIGRTPIEPALTDARASIEADVLARSQAILDRYGVGVQLSQVQLLRVDPPAEVIDSFRDVQRANTEAERAVNDAQSYANNIVPRARGEAAVITAAGDADRQASVAEATGQAHRFDSVLAAYQKAKDVTLRRLYIETMEQLLAKAPSVIVDDQFKNMVPLLPLTGNPAAATGTQP